MNNPDKQTDRESKD